MHRSYLCSSAAALLTFASTSAYGEDVIVVTATRAEVAADQLAPMLDVIDLDDLHAGNIITLTDALGEVPAMQAVGTGAAGAQTSVFTRGTNSNHTLVLLDGVRLNEASTPAGAFDFGQDTIGDAARIEAVRGPLSSVYGSDAVGGAVNIIPRLGQAGDTERFYDVSAGEFETYRALVGVSGGTERASYLVSAEAFETEGFDQVPERFALSTGDPDGGRMLTLTGAGTFGVTDTVSLEGLARVRQAESEFDSFGAGPFFAQRGDDPDLEITQNDYTVWRAGAAYASPGGGFESRARVGQVLVDREFSNDGAATDVFSSERTFAEWLNVWRPEERGGFVAPTLTFGLQADEEDIANDAAFSDPLDRGERHAGVFAVAHAGLGSRLYATASARHDDHEAFGGVTTGGLGLVFDLPEAGTQLTASFGTSYRAPTLTERFSESPFEAPNPNLASEKGESWELGARTVQTIGGRQGALRAGASWYETEIDDLIVFVFDPSTFVGTNVNIGAAEISGYEAYVDVEPADWGAARLSYAYADARDADTGVRLARRAAHVWSARVDVRPHDRVSLGAEWRYVGRRLDTNYDDDGFFVGSGLPIESFETVRLTGQLELSGAAVLYATLENALDESYEQPDAFASAPRALTVGVRGRF
ncbi:MAG: TonB-dependent receptor [Maricaulaceae bacterium]|jgi:vitamin B12 transporter